MNTSYYQAKLINENNISLLVFTSMVRQSDDIFFFLVKDSKIIERVNPTKTTSMNNVRFFNIKLKDGYDYGHHYEIFIPHFGSIPVDVSDAIYFPDFDEKFYYDGNDLGATYTKEKTSFAVWVPLASSVAVTLYINDEKVSYDMVRGEKGVYRVDVYGDYENVGYQYIITNSEIARRVNDPYGKGLTLNSKYSAVVDIQKIKSLTPSVPYESCDIQDASIYELNVRDFTIDKHTNIEHKGKYLGLIEEGKTTTNGLPAGLDYLKYLGISHIQLLPVLDFDNVSDENPDQTYNWGYDVTHFFAIEGSYSLHPENPTERLIELRKVVNAMHKNNIGVNIDVVYNHIWSYESSIFEKILPGYFFRKNKEGRMFNGSGCGNDIASERPMVSKMIVDSTCWLCDMFDIDGLRFDLMGLLDIKTMNNLTDELKRRKPKFFVYGEGWHIPTGIPGENQTSIPNSFKADRIGHFNDAFRDILKGSTFDMGAKGYINGATDYVGGMFYALMGTSNEYIFPARFKYASQSINYVECHDNSTIYDKLVYSLPNEDEETILKRVNFANSLIAFSFGVPFFHMGQEIGLSKGMEDNTYNMGDKYNKFDYKMLEKRADMARYFKSLIAFRKKVGIFHEVDPKKIMEMLNFEQMDKNGLRVYVKHTKLNDKEAVILANPNNETLYYELDDYYNVAFTNGGIAHREICLKHVTHSPFSVVWLIKK